MNYRNASLGVGDFATVPRNTNAALLVRAHKTPLIIGSHLTSAVVTRWLTQGPEEFVRQARARCGRMEALALGRDALRGHCQGASPSS